MIKNFDEIKGQLKELASIINAFKSEAVQLRIAELIFQGAEVGTEEEETTGKPQEKVPKQKEAKKKAKKTKMTVGKKKVSKKGRPGPAKILYELIEEGFFNEPKTINEIISHCSSQKARILKANELSPPLARFVRDKKLKRDKNPDGQYQYEKA